MKSERIILIYAKRIINLKKKGKIKVEISDFWGKSFVISFICYMILYVTCCL